MFIKLCTRFLHTSRIVLATDKNSLAALRKKTGYTFANCKKALELHNNDINKAEKWLKEQAKELGWSKATKLEGRTTAQGLIGVLIRNNIGTMVEVNCETDFVARNEKFQSFVDHTSRVCAEYTEQSDFDGDLWKLGFESEALKNLKLLDGSNLGDHLLGLIGSVGENATIKRAICFKTNNHIKLAGYAHPSNFPTVEQDKTYFGKYGAIVAFRAPEDLNGELSKNLCQHIVGLNPEKIGEFGKDEPIENKDDEKCLIHQEYLLDPERTVGEVLKENNIQIVDFQRFECGEMEKDQSLDVAKFVN